ncbi:4a-hydroxytetrahydrobiopterin dehydratase [Streptomyces sp. RFCAC02]|uniref:4a-hydroxytetrahydrobiopterin dehydratase n=1 Tax=Streptomyces sp. RFCAC02 TaxID=2499143 RepID=UPI00101FFCE7|nr:4a-hydroxytetrahydrobiopterin dehydratase [Streptomyces sp. RFCAC02]
MAAKPLTEQEIDRALTGLSGWTAEDGRLVRGYGMPNHLAAVALLVHIASIQEELNHHADLTVTYDRVGVSVTTHSAGGRLTDLDVRLAGRIEEIAPAHGAV